MLDYLNRSYINFSGDQNIELLIPVFNSLLIEIYAIEEIQNVPSSGVKLAEALVAVKNEKEQIEKEINDEEIKIGILQETLEKFKEKLIWRKFSLEEFLKEKKDIKKLQMNKEILDIYLKAPKEIHW